MGLANSIPASILKPGVCTSTTRPANPYKGQAIYETDTGNELTYQGSTTGWTPPWNTAWGRILETVQSNSPTVGTTQLYVLTSSGIPMYSNRRYTALMVLQGAYGTITADNYVMGMDIDGGTLGTTPVYIISGNQYITPGMLLAPFTVASGSHVFRAWAYRSSGSGSLQFRVQYVISDDGPNGAPP